MIFNVTDKLFKTSQNIVEHVKNIAVTLNIISKLTALSRFYMSNIGSVLDFENTKIIVPCLTVQRSLISESIKILMRRGMGVKRATIICLIKFQEFGWIYLSNSLD